MWIGRLILSTVEAGVGKMVDIRHDMSNVVGEAFVGGCVHVLEMNLLGNPLFGRHRTRHNEWMTFSTFRFLFIDMV